MVQKFERCALINENLMREELELFFLLTNNIVQPKVTRGDNAS